ncbi:Subtilisin-like protease [Quillaja saponaria]|uniref:Subtilisin-like protease n=1 Tax=Quillaja saponaria TaxID=32244 RepID=A0AAD7Q6E6_QUISA|nr:Subtilisin-like protease [Quillaja saponaria]
MNQTSDVQGMKGDMELTLPQPAGKEIEGASYFGLAKGLARDGGPSVRIAVYKACWLKGCYSEDILAAFDDAIADGVDILSVSFGTAANAHYFDDLTAI